jgi:glycosyltransferase involved in cell wall biosynthesis
MKKIKVALIHDFLREYGGAERVLEELHKIFPQAPIYVAFLDKQALGQHRARFEDWDIRQTWFAKIPAHKRFYSPLRFLAPKSFASLDLSEYDLVISSSNAFEAKAVSASSGRHICYCHTPPRALYGYSTMSNWKKNPIVKLGGQLINHYMRVSDFNAARQVDYFLANSEETQARIKKFYRRESTVVYPPVAVEKIKARAQNSQPKDYYFYIGRLGLQKHPEIAVKICTKLNLPLKLAGTGPMLAKLKQLAGKSVEFLGAVPDDQLWQLYSEAKALLYPVEDEDFGIVPVEAMAAGTPVIAHRSGGPSYTIKTGKTGKQGKTSKQVRTGLFVSDFKLESWEQALQKFQSIQFNRKEIQQEASKYSTKKFHQQIKKFCGTILPGSVLSQLDQPTK